MPKQKPKSDVRTQHSTKVPAKKTLLVKMTKQQWSRFQIWQADKDAAKRGVLTDYKPEYCNDVIDFFKKACEKPFEVMNVVAKDKKGNVILDKQGQPIYYDERIPNMPPYLVDYAIKVGVLVDSLSDWARAHPDFNRALTHAKEIRTKMLVNNGLTGLYDPHSWIFTAKNLSGMSDKTEVKQETEVSFKVKLQRFDNPEEADDVAQVVDSTSRITSNMPR